MATTWVELCWSLLTPPELPSRSAHSRLDTFLGTQFLPSYVPQSFRKMLLHGAGDLISKLTSASPPIRLTNQYSGEEDRGSDVSSAGRQERSSQLQAIAEEDRENEIISHGMTLLLAARERVLTLSEQRVSDRLCFQRFH